MKFLFLDKFGSLGAVVAAASCPFCFPLLGAAGAAFGLGFLKPYEGAMVYLFQGLVVLAFFGNVLSYLNHRKKGLLILGFFSAATVFFAFYVRFNEILLYAGLAGLFVSAVLNTLENRRCRICQSQGKST